jgi:ribulose-5-phosphate 4-epimerase/fuculose-1-phosphate aldolase
MPATEVDTRTVVDDLVMGNHILAAQNVADAYGHISARHPTSPDRYLIARATAPELVTAEDIMEVALDGEVLGGDTRKAYLERYIHAAIYQARPDITSVIHAHTHSVLPFSVTQQRLRPITHNCATIGRDIPVWDQRTTFGDTNLLVSSMDIGRELASVLGSHHVVLMRGHGATVTGHSVREAVYTAVYLQLNAELQIQAGHFPPITFLSDGEIEIIRTRLADAQPGEGYDRAWEYWSRRASVS